MLVGIDCDPLLLLPAEAEEEESARVGVGVGSTPLLAPARGALGEEA